MATAPSQRPLRRFRDSGEAQAPGVGRQVEARTERPVPGGGAGRRDPMIGGGGRRYQVPGRGGACRLRPGARWCVSGGRAQA